MEEVVGGDIDLGFAWWEGWKVDGVNVGVAGEHQLELEPFDLLHAGLGIAGGREGVCDVRTPADDFLVLIVVKDSGNLCLVNDPTPVGMVVRPKRTFCFVWFPAPGHSVMMSSLASLFVAKAKATPENVVP